MKERSLILTQNWPWTISNPDIREENWKCHPCVTAANDDQGPGLGHQLLLCQTHQRSLWMSDRRIEVCNYCAIIHCYRHITVVWWSRDRGSRPTITCYSCYRLCPVCHNVEVKGATSFYRRMMLLCSRNVQFAQWFISARPESGRSITWLTAGCDVDEVVIASVLPPLSLHWSENFNWGPGRAASHYPSTDIGKLINWSDLSISGWQMRVLRISHWGESLAWPCIRYWPGLGLAGSIDILSNFLKRLPSLWPVLALVLWNC